jgi:hypothetical protein
MNLSNNRDLFCALVSFRLCRLGHPRIGTKFDFGCFRFGVWVFFFLFGEIMGEAKHKQENPLISIVVNIVIPVTVLSLLSKEKYLGPVWALVVGLSFPIGYGLRTLIRDRKADFMSMIGIFSVTLTGVFGILKLPPQWVAIKEAAIPLIMGLAIVGSLKTPFPLIKKILMTEALFDVQRLKDALREKGNEAIFEKRLVGLTWGFAASMFLSSGLSYVLAKIVLQSEPGTEAYTAELG